jgi:hypothetical protein
LRRAGRAEALGSILAGNVTLLTVRFGPPSLFASTDATVAGLVASAAAFALILVARHLSDGIRVTRSGEP